MTPHVETYESADDLARAAACRIADRARDAISGRGTFDLVLAGGSTPELTYRALVDVHRHHPLNLDCTRFFIGDERWVPPEDSRSNIGAARRALLDPLGVRPDAVFGVPTWTTDPTEGANDYEESLRHIFAGRPVPAFDLVLLGLGEDGHTASLFPHMPSIDERVRWAVATPPGELPPAIDRVTLTFPAINAAREIVFLVTGSKKAEAVAKTLEPGVKPADVPAAGVRGDHVTWMLDSDAAAGLSSVANDLRHFSAR